MDRQKNQWEHRIIEHVGTAEEQVHIFKGRCISSMDVPEMLRKAGVPAGDTAFTKIVMQYPDILVEVAMGRCILSHKIGYGLECEFSPVDFDQDEVDIIMLRIMRPFKLNIMKAALEAGEGSVLDVFTEKEIAFGKENNWFTPEEEAAIDAEVFLAKGHEQADSPAVKVDQQAPP